MANPPIKKSQTSRPQEKYYIIHEAFIICSKSIHPYLVPIIATQITIFDRSIAPTSISNSIWIYDNFPNYLSLLSRTRKRHSPTPFHFLSWEVIQNPAYLVPLELSHRGESVNNEFVAIGEDWKGSGIIFSSKVFPLVILFISPMTRFVFNQYSRLYRHM